MTISSAWASSVNTASVLAAEVLSRAIRLVTGSIQIATRVAFGNALGMRSSSASCFSSLRCFLPGLRPVSSSILRAAASTHFLISTPGTERVSTWAAMM